MKNIKTNLLLIVFAILMNCKNEKTTPTSEVEKDKENTTTVEANEAKEELNIIPIEHATLILETADNVIYVDPTGGAAAFEGQRAPTIILITDIHGDHLDTKTLEAINLENAAVIAPKAVADKIPNNIVENVTVMNNGEEKTIKNINIEAIPMYNLREEALKFHEKGRGNGYVLNIGKELIYISGDTEDIPEMRNLKNIDKAFVCMNLPYTMTVESAASAVLDFKPEIVYPYHYRGSDGFSDIEKFKTLVNKENSKIKVVQLDWY